VALRQAAMPYSADAHATVTGAAPAPSHPRAFINPWAVARRRGGTTSYSDAQIFAS
jgi:hypothetical protein